MPQEKLRTIHLYFEEDEPPTVDAEPEPSCQRVSPLTILCLSLAALFCVGIPVLGILAGQAWPTTYDTTRSQTFALTLSLHPAHGQLPLYALPPIKETQHLTVAASGSQHQDATKATGLITFYNGAFTAQTVTAGTKLTGKSGIEIVTTQTAIIPAATPTTPPTYGTFSVAAISSSAGTVSNIPASDIDQACCAPSILAQNLDAFSGGQDAQDIPILTKGDISDGQQKLTAQVDEAVNGQAQQELKPAYIMLPLGCKSSFSADHQSGDHAATAMLELTETCTPLAYFAPDIADLAQQRVTIPAGYQLVSLSSFVLQSNVTNAGGTLTVQAIAYLKREIPAARPYYPIGR